MDKGFSLSYWKGIHSKVDVALKANVSFRDYAAIRTGKPKETEIGFELEPTLNLRPFDDAALLNPFLTVGAGAGWYSDKIGFYVPAGLGLQVNFNSITYAFVQAQYRWDLTKKDPQYGNRKVTGNNLFYSVGLAQNIGKEKV
jgi:hypothetical protein